MILKRKIKKTYTKRDKFKNAKTISIYVSRNNEPDILDLIKNLMKIKQCMAY